MAEDPKPVCFVISPIGDRGSDTWERSDKTIRHLIGPAVEAHGFAVKRADMEERPGMITTQIIRRLIDSPLVVADLTDHNPNVFYELAVRHVTRKPLIQIIKADQRIPFDVAMMRTIKFDLTDPDVLEQARQELEGQIEAVKDLENLETPISAAVDLKHALESGDENQVQLAEMKSELQSLVAEVRSQRQAPAFTTFVGSTGRFQPSVKTSESPDVTYLPVGVRRTADGKWVMPSDESSSAFEESQGSSADKSSEEDGGSS